METKLPSITQKVIDKSDIGSLVDDNLVIGMPIESDTGKLDVTHIRSQAELLNLFSETGAVNTELSTTMLHALKILQFNSIYVSRAVNTKVLPARSDKVGSNGSSALYVDDAYQPYYKVWKFAFEQKKPKYKWTFLDITYTPPDILLASEARNPLLTEGSDNLVTENSESGDIRFRVAVGIEDEANVENDIKTKLGPDRVTVSTLLYKKLELNSDSGVTIDDLLLELNDILNDPKYSNLNIPNFIKIELTEDYINVVGGLGIKINYVCEGDSTEPTTDCMISNEVHNDYGLVRLTESKTVELTLEDYIYIGGASYFIEGASNITYPGTQYPMDVYSGCVSGNKNIGIPVFGKDTLDSTGFSVYMLDEQVNSKNVVPSFLDFDLKFSFDLIKDGYIDWAQQTVDINDDSSLIKSELSRYLKIEDDESSESISKFTISATNNILNIQDLEAKLGLTGLALKINITGTSEGANLYICIDNPNLIDFREGKDYRVDFNDIHTFQKLVYRLYEFMYEPNINATYVLDKNGHHEIVNNGIYKVNEARIQNKFLENIIVSIYGEDSDQQVVRIFDYYQEGSDKSSRLASRNKMIVTIPTDDVTDIVYPRDGYKLGDPKIPESSLIMSGYGSSDFDDALLFYTKSEINSFAIPDGSNIYDVVECASLEDEDLLLYSYNIFTAKTNNLLRKYKNSYVTIEKTINTGTPEESITYYIFYNGKWTLGKDPQYERINISPAALTYQQFMDELRDALKTKFISTNLTNGFALYEYDTNTRYRIVDTNLVPREKVVENETIIEYVEEDTELVVNGQFGLSDQLDPVIEFIPGLSSITDYTELIENSALIVCSKAPNKSNILKFELNVDEDDPELYTLSLTRKGDTVDYTISFTPNKVDGYGRSVFYTYVNDEDNGSEHFYLTRLNTDPTFLPADTVKSPLFGSEVLISKATTGDFKAAIDRFKDKLGIYYDILFDGGQVNTIVQNYLYNTGRQIFALAVLGMPDIKDWRQLRAYRNSVDINHWEAWMSAPRVPDSTLGEFVLDLVPGTQYLQRIVLNKSGGAEFAPMFGITNGPGSLPPKYKYYDEDIRTSLVNSQINPYIWHRARQLPYFELDLTMQTKDSSLSDANNVRMINCMAHIADQISEKYIGRYNDPGTRLEFLTEVRIAINQRIIDHQKYRIADYRLICDETNNPDDIVERRLLVLDIYSKFRPGIREAKVYHTVYKLSQDLYAI